MTIADHFDPYNTEHLKAWRKLEEKWGTHGDRNTLAAEQEFLYQLSSGASWQSFSWPDDWGPLIIAKMANAWLVTNFDDLPIFDEGESE